MEAVNIFAEFVKQKTNKQGLAPIAIRIDLNRSRAVTEFLPYKIAVTDWDPVQRKAKPSCQLGGYINQVIDHKILMYRTWELKRRAFHLPVTKDMLKMLVKQGGTETFAGYAERVLESKTLKDGKGYAEETKRRYRDELKRVESYAAGLGLSAVTPDWLQQYRIYMQGVYFKKDGTRLSINGIWNAFKFIRMVFNQAVEERVILPEQNPFASFKFDAYQQNTEKIKFLEMGDVEALENVLLTRHLPDLTLAVGWRFLAMCVCGMRISDAMRLNLAFFDDAGNLAFKPHKTRRHNNQANIPVVSERQRRYLQKAVLHTLPGTDPKNFRTTFNNQLKVLAAAAGIDVNLTSHVGRHTMGSFLVDASVDKKAAMAMLGVKSEKVIDTYMHLKQSKLQSEALKLKNVF